MPVKLVEVVRGDLVESTHYGDIVVVNEGGKILHELGNSSRLTFFRSASKPFQAITSLEAGIAEKFGIDLKEIALIASSHSGEKQHIDVLMGMLEKIGISQEGLQCGVHLPINKTAAREMLLSGQNPSTLHCNCSAKHAGLIAACKIKSFNIEEYYKYDHPIEKEIDNTISDFSNIEAEKIVKGIDGCGLPVHAVPLKNIALAYANLCNEDFQDGKYRKSQNYVLSAMTMYPEMVAGEGRLDTELMRKFGDRLVCKIGTEGIYCVGILAKKVGIALKIEDGNSRAIGPAIFNILLQLGIIKKDELEGLEDYWNPEIINNKGDKVGEITANFKLR